MGRYKIELVTMGDCNDFVKSISNCQGVILLESSNGFRVNAKSLLGAIAATEWNDLYCISDSDIYTSIRKWVKADS